MGKDYRGHPAGSGKLKDESIRAATPAENLEGIDELLEHAEDKDELLYDIGEEHPNEKKNRENSIGADDRQ